MFQTLTTNRPRVTPTRNQLALRGLITVLVVLIIVEAMRLHTSGVWDGPPRVTAQLRNAGGALTKGSDVKLRGVIVGKVEDIEPGDGFVKVDLDMDKSQLGSIPAGVVARVLPATVFGTTYVDLRPTGAIAPSHGASLRAGAIIGADKTQATLELQDALDDIDGLVKALNPAELSTAIGAAAVALDGRGAELGRTAVALDAYLKQFNPKITMLRADLDKLAQFLQVVKSIAPNLLDATDDALVALNTLATHKADLKALLTDGRSLADTSTTMLAKNSVRLTRFIDAAYGVIDAIYDNRDAGITQATAINRSIAGIVKAAEERGYIKIDASVQLTAPPYYGAGDRPNYGGGR